MAKLFLIKSSLFQAMIWLKKCVIKFDDVIYGLAIFNVSTTFLEGTFRILYSLDNEYDLCTAEKLPSSNAICRTIGGLDHYTCLDGLWQKFCETSSSAGQKWCECGHQHSIGGTVPLIALMLQVNESHIVQSWLMIDEILIMKDWKFANDVRMFVNFRHSYIFIYIIIIILKDSSFLRIIFPTLTWILTFW